MAKRQLSQKQKEWVRARDGHRCQFHSFDPRRGLVRCPNTKDLHVHHIKPHRYLAEMYPVVFETPANLLTLCKTHHFRFVHPDMWEALNNYHGDRDAIRKVFSQRDKIVKMGYPYWNTRFDDIFKYIANEATREYIKRNPWPENGSA